ncbi:MAG: DUF89 family protein [Clostridia bacterium]|nr:DUF89 family protein [Clostridia bacterium]
MSRTFLRQMIERQEAELKVKHECIPCLVRQANEISELLVEDKKTQEAILRFALKELSEITFEETAPYLAMKVHNYVKEVTGNCDPYKSFKVQFNSIAEDLIEELDLRDKITDSQFPFDMACRLSIAGNVIDFGLGIHIDRQKVERSIKGSIEAELFGMTTNALWDRINEAKSIMIITDNAGEIVFDKLLVEQMPMDKITYVVKGGPIVNDATMEDAVDVGMTKLVKVIDNGLAASTGIT